MAGYASECQITRSKGAQDTTTGTATPIFQIKNSSPTGGFTMEEQQETQILNDRMKTE